MKINLKALFTKFPDKLNLIKKKHLGDFPSDEENYLIQKLKRKAGKYQKELIETNSKWQNNMSCLYDHLINDDVRSFLRWDIITGTMFVPNAPYVKTEFSFLKNLTLWDDRWSNAILESKVGNPIPFKPYPKTSSNLIHHAYHLAQYEEKTNSRINDNDFIFEFGGGYGSMCRLFYNLDFKGRYILFDLPIFAALQEYYLKMLSLEVNLGSFDKDKKNGIFCISNFDHLSDIIGYCLANKETKSLFVATWSLSETPLKLRKSILPLISNFDNILISYQNYFDNIDNCNYFNSFKSHFKDMSWCNFEIDHLPGNYYLIGKS